MLTPTKLRSDLYRVLDEIIATGQPLEVLRDGHVLRIALTDIKPPADRRGIVARIPFRGDAYHLDLKAEPTTWTWDPDANVDPPS